MSIRLIGDSHGINHRFPNRRYLAKEAEGRTLVKLVHDAEYCIQLGDIGWGNDLDTVKNFNLDTFKFLPGNHDNYDDLLPHSLGDYGVSSLNGVEFGFIRGEYSVDKDYRCHYGKQKSWWEQEELTASQMVDCQKYFDSLTAKPTLMLSHGCPNFLFDKGVITNTWKLTPSMTSQLLSSVYHSVRPALWVFGHHHRNWVYKHEDTTFVCLNELCFADIRQEENKYTLTGDINLEVEI